LNDRKNILIIINNLRSGGSQKQAVLYANQLAVDNDVYFLMLRGFNQTNLFFSYLIDSRVNQVAVKSSSPVLLVATMVRLLVSNRFDYCINFQPIANFLGTVFSKIFQRQTVVVCTVRGNAPVNYKYIKWWIKLADIIWVNSQQILDVLSTKFQIPVSKMLLQHNLVETNARSDSYKKGYILHVGRFNQVKNQMQLIRAFTQLDHKTELELHLVGEIEDLSYYNEVLALIKAKQIENVFIHTKTDQLSDYYKNAELFVLTSKSEGMPNVILEAQSFGVPVISSSVGDVAKIIKHGDNGFIYDSREESLIHCFNEYYMMKREEKLKLRELSIKELEIFATNNNVSLLRNLEMKLKK
jgi:GalNAc-alpha-(1->4)-GalNAc-alpha-(1->3)-diNAcBac-PP-undecaprenol alpha-1,4-N-acetyl-D-galactosaminyltransferase